MSYDTAPQYIGGPHDGMRVTVTKAKQVEAVCWDYKSYTFVPYLYRRGEDGDYHFVGQANE